ncbi:MAG: PTS ascorbate transporter subunit IIC [Candidatus Asgardarchaeia archaeon]
MQITDILIFIATQIIGNAAILYGLIAFVGSLLLRKPIEDVLVGTLKTMIGYYILIVGAMGLQDVITPVAAAIGSALGVTGVQPAVWAVFGEGMTKKGSETALVCLVGFIVNLVLAAATKIKTVHITGHIMLIWAAFFTMVPAGYAFESWQLILIGGICMGVYFWISTAIIYYFMRGSDQLTSEWTLGIGDSIGIALTSWISKVIGNKEESTEEIKYPKRLEWLRDSQIAIAVFCSVIFFIVGLVAGESVIAPYAGGTNWIIYLLLLGVQFSAYLAALLYGVRILIGAIVPAFKGFSEKLIKGAVPGLDYPTMFPFAQTGMFLGFLANLAGGILATLVMVAMGSPIIILPSIFQNFWTGALLGVFGNAYGGKRGAIIAPFILGFIAPFGWAVLYPISGGLSTTHVVQDYTDSCVFGILYALLVKFIAQLLGVPPIV